MRLPASIPFQAAAILAAAGLCGLLSNALAAPGRHLAWLKGPIPAAVVVPEVTPPPASPEPKAAPLPARPIPKPPTPAPSRPEAPSPTPVREITSAEAFDAFQGGAAFLDARRSAEFEAGHIQGAFSLPVWESVLDERLVEFEAKANRPPEAPLVLYCGGGDCQDSHMLASRLFQMGYRRLLIYREGYPDWTRQGRPTAKGGRP